MEALPLEKLPYAPQNFLHRTITVGLLNRQSARSNTVILGTDQGAVSVVATHNEVACSVGMACQPA